MLCHEYCKTFKNTCFDEHLRKIDSVLKNLAPKFLQKVLWNSSTNGIKASHCLFNILVALQNNIKISWIEIVVITLGLGSFCFTFLAHDIKQRQSSVIFYLLFTCLNFRFKFLVERCIVLFIILSYIIIIKMRCYKSFI